MNMEMNNPATLIGIAGMAIASIVGLVVWLVKNSQKRQDLITDRYFANLEKKDEQNQKRDEQSQKTIDVFGENMRKISDHLDKHGQILARISDKQDGTCRIK